MSIELNDEQKYVVQNVSDWYSKIDQRVLKLGGFAGTGKTTVIAEIRKRLPNHHRVSFCAFTGKATSVLRSKITLEKFDTCSTIHSLMYKPIIDKKTKKIIGWERRSDLDTDLIIVDEASMINGEIYKDMIHYGVPIFFIGDHGQLPPIGVDNFNLMKAPDLRLETIQRQSENHPIIKLSIMARRNGNIPLGYYANQVVKVPSKHPLVSEFIKNSKNFQDTIIICGFNSTRIHLNKQIRKFLNRDEDCPQVGDRVVCLKNNHQSQNGPIFNGVLGTIENIAKAATHFETEISIDNEDYSYFGPITFSTFNNKEPKFDEPNIKRMKIDANNARAILMVEQKLDYFDYGYVLSCHKSQGSEWRRVMVIEQQCQYWAGENWNRWLYTAITRSTEQLIIVGR